LAQVKARTFSSILNSYSAYEAFMTLRIVLWCAACSCTASVAYALQGVQTGQKKHLDRELEECTAVDSATEENILDELLSPDQSLGKTIKIEDIDDVNSKQGQKEEIQKNDDVQDDEQIQEKKDDKEEKVETESKEENMEEKEQVEKETNQENTEDLTGTTQVKETQENENTSDEEVQKQENEKTLGEEVQKQENEKTLGEEVQKQENEKTLGEEVQKQENEETSDEQVQKQENEKTPDEVVKKQETKTKFAGAVSKTIATNKIAKGGRKNLYECSRVLMYSDKDKYDACMAVKATFNECRKRKAESEEKMKPTQIDEACCDELTNKKKCGIFGRGAAMLQTREEMTFNTCEKEASKCVGNAIKLDECVTKEPSKTSDVFTAVVTALEECATQEIVFTTAGKTYMLFEDIYIANCGSNPKAYFSPTTTKTEAVEGVDRMIVNDYSYEVARSLILGKTFDFDSKTVVDVTENSGTQLQLVKANPCITTTIDYETTRSRKERSVSTVESKDEGKAFGHLLAKFARMKKCA